MRAFLSLGMLLAVVGLSGAALAGRVEIRTSKEVYDLSETVFFTVTNGLEEAIEMPSFPYWFVLDEDGNRYAGCSGLPTIHTIPPGGSEVHSWSQVSCVTGEPADAGLYYVGFNYWVESDPITQWRVQTPFCLGEGCVLPTEVDDEMVVLRWGEVKAVYRE